ncbi:MAG: hypothetical protein ACKO6K_11365, partial [Chitinophagaceae bacterium]
MKNFTLSPCYSRVSQKTLKGLILSKGFRIAVLFFLFNFLWIGLSYSQCNTGGTVSPLDTTICKTGTAILRITGATDGSDGSFLRYQWQKTIDTTSGFADITSANSDSYTFIPSNNDTTYFRVVVNIDGNACDGDTSLVIRVAVVAEPVAGTVEPSDTTICASGTATLRITGSTGGGTLTYKWQSTTDTTAG